MINCSDRLSVLVVRIGEDLHYRVHGSDRCFKLFEKIHNLFAFSLADPIAENFVELVLMFTPSSLASKPFFVKKVLSSD